MSRLPRPTCFVLLATILLASVAAQASTHCFSIRGKSDFADVQEQLQVVVDEHARRVTNRFCVVAEAIGGATEAWVYWPEGGKLILWLPDRDNPHAIAGSKRYLDLKRDVENGNDLHGSTYRLTRATANEKVQACKLHGEIYTIEKHPGLPTSH